jgi:hypothetical protein
LNKENRDTRLKWKKSSLAMILKKQEMKMLIKHFKIAHLTI